MQKEGASMKIAAVQLDVVLGDVDTNYAIAEKAIIQAARAGANIVVLPEMWNTSFYPLNVQQLADDDGRRTKAFFTSLAKQYHVHIVGGSVANCKADGVYNTTYVVNRESEIVGTYDKVHVFTPGGEDKAFCAGNRLNVFTLDGITMASIICYDLRFAEWVRMAALAGAKVLFVPAAWPDVRIDQWQILNRARAIENQMIVVAVNNCGTAGNLHFGGHSMIIDPLGSVLGEGEEAPTIVTADVDTDCIASIRETLNVFRDRRPELYQIHQ